MIFIYSSSANEVKENNFQEKIKQELKHFGQSNIFNKIAISIVPIFNKDIFFSEPKFIAQTIVKDQLDPYRESTKLYNEVYDYLKFARNGINVVDIVIKIEKL